jgi:hypothetical protein
MLKPNPIVHISTVFVIVSDIFTDNTAGTDPVAKRQAAQNSAIMIAVIADHRHVNTLNLSLSVISSILPCLLFGDR